MNSLRKKSCSIIIIGHIYRFRIALDLKFIIGTIIFAGTCFYWCFSVLTRLISGPHKTLKLRTKSFAGNTLEWFKLNPWLMKMPHTSFYSSLILGFSLCQILINRRLNFWQEPNRSQTNPELIPHSASRVTKRIAPLINDFLSGGFGGSCRIYK